MSPEWPKDGRLEISDVVMRYRPGLSPSLKGITINVAAGEKVRELVRLIAFVTIIAHGSIS